MTDAASASYQRALLRVGGGSGGSSEKQQQQQREHATEEGTRAGKAAAATDRRAREKDTNLPAAGAGVAAGGGAAAGEESEPLARTAATAGQAAASASAAATNRPQHGVQEEGGGISPPAVPAATATAAAPEKATTAETVDGVSGDAATAAAAAGEGGGDDEDDDLLQRLTEIESLCTQCGKNGKTLMLLHRVPHFKDILISSFSCPHCDYSNREVEGVGPLAAQGVRLQLQVAEEEDLKRQVVISEFATVLLPDVELEIPPSYSSSNSMNRRSAVKTVEGIVRDAAEALAAGQETRRAVSPDVAARIDELLSRLHAFAEGKSPFRLQLDDPSGNSYIEALPPPLHPPPTAGVSPVAASSPTSAPSSSAAPAAAPPAAGAAAAAVAGDAGSAGEQSSGIVGWMVGEATGQDLRLKKEFYTRTREQLHAMGYYEQQQQQNEEDEEEEDNDEKDDATKEEEQHAEGEKKTQKKKRNETGEKKEEEAGRGGEGEQHRVWDLSKPLEETFGRERYNIRSSSSSAAAEAATAEAKAAAAAAEKEEEDHHDVAGWSMPVECPHCGVSGSNRICEIDVPGFRRCLIFSFLCDSCGARETEVKPAGAFGPAGRRWTLRVETQEDLNRDVLKSDTATVCIPSLQLTMQGGTQGGDFTTVEGLLEKLAESLENTSAFATGDSAPPERRERVLAVTAKLRAMKEGPTADAAEPKKSQQQQHEQQKQQEEEGGGAEQKQKQQQQQKEVEKEKREEVEKQTKAGEDSVKPFLLIIDDCADMSFVGGRRSHAISMALLQQQLKTQAAASEEGGGGAGAAEKRETLLEHAAEEKKHQQQKGQGEEREKQESQKDDEQKRKEAALSAAAIAAAAEGQILWTERRDPQLLTEIYKRTLEQDDELGLSDMQV